MSMAKSTGDSNSVGAGTPRIQISLSKEQRKSTATEIHGDSSNGNDNANANAKDSIESLVAADADANSGLYKSVRKALKTRSLNFKINVECTSLKVSPSGNFLWGGFSDGTLRVWDLSGTFGVEDDDVVASRQKTDVLVNSKLTQGYGAVACQIHARGVHTDLITTVDISDDAKYVFVGVARGATELHAVFIGDLERAVHNHKQREHHYTIKRRNILDYIKVYCASDAKLKGFGACATMTVQGIPNHNANKDNTNQSTSYMLLTGKGIKNLHIWKFTPPEHPNSSSEVTANKHSNGSSRSRNLSICDPPDDEEDNGIWDQLYDTATNGNSIVLLGFYRNLQNKLLAVSKSDAQKLRLWDLSFEESSGITEAAREEHRPKRPNFEDVANSRSALEIAGGIGVCGGGNMYNEMSIVSLDKPDDPFNHTELALPSAVASSDVSQNPSPYSSRRQRRGEMKAVVKVATSPRDSSHALLELDDGSLVGYSAGTGNGGSSASKDSAGSIPKLAIATPESTGIPALPADFWRRCICLANIAGVVIAASSLYNPNTNKGQLVIRALGGLKKPRGSKVLEKKKLRLQKQKERLERELLKQQERAERERVEKEQFEREQQRQLVLVLKQQQQKQREQEMQEQQRKRERAKQEREQEMQDQQRNRERAKQEQQRREMAPPATPSPSHTNFQLSPMSADTQALRDAVSAPKAVPVSMPRTNHKKPLDAKTEKLDAPNATATQSSSSASLTKVSPNTRVSPNSSVMETPRHQKNYTSPNDSSPDSAQGLPTISKFLQPKRIDMNAQQLQNPSKKRKAPTPKEIVTTKAASAASIPKKEVNATKKAKKASVVAETKSDFEKFQATKKPTVKPTAAIPDASNAPDAMLRSNSAGSVPFQSPKPPPKKEKTVNAPSKPKKPIATTNVTSVSFSMPKASQVAPKKDFKINAESCVAVAVNPSEKSIAKVSSDVGERKRDRPVFDNALLGEIASKKIARSSEEVTTALFLTSLASPKPVAKGKSKPSDGTVGAATLKKTVATSKPKAVATVTPKVAAVAGQSKATVKITSKPKAPGDSSRSRVVPLPSSTKKTSNGISKSKGKPATPQNTSDSPQKPSREEILYEKVFEQYNQLSTFLKRMTSHSMAFIHSRNLRGPVPLALASGAAKSDKTHVSGYSELLTEHRATHDYLQRRLLRSAETTLRLLLESRITPEEARTELKQSMKKFEEILYDTLNRQEAERLAVVGQYYGSPSNFARGRTPPNGDKDPRSETTKEQSNYPCKEAFDKVEDICAAIARPVGRPRSALAALR